MVAGGRLDEAAGLIAKLMPSGRALALPVENSSG